MTLPANFRSVIQVFVVFLGDLIGRLRSIYMHYGINAVFLFHIISISIILSLASLPGILKKLEYNRDLIFDQIYLDRL